VGLQSTYSSHQLQPCAHGALCVIFMGLRIPEIHEDPIAHILRYKTADALHRFCDARLIADMTSRKSSGSMRADSAVEPTRSENITVTWRRSAVSCGAADEMFSLVGLGAIVSSPFNSAIARSN